MSKKIILGVSFISMIMNVYSCDQSEIDATRRSGSHLLFKKSMASHCAFLERDTDHLEKLKNMKISLETGSTYGDPTDKVFKDLSQTYNSGIKEKYEVIRWLEDSIYVAKINLNSVKKTIDEFHGTWTVDNLLLCFKKHMNIREAYFDQRVNTSKAGVYLASTLPVNFQNLGPASQLAVQISVDKHALMLETLKEIYSLLLLHSPSDAQLALTLAGEKTTLGAYIQGHVKEVLDPDTCLMKDRRVIASNGSFSYVVDVPLNGLDITKDRMRMKLQQRRTQAAGGQVIQPTQKTGKPVKKGKGPSPEVIGLLKENIARNEAEIHARELEKKRRSEVCAQRSAKLREALEQARLSREGILQDPAPQSQVCEDLHTSVRVKEKTKGVADPSRDTKATPQIQANPSHGSVSMASVAHAHTNETANISSGVLKKLEYFWETKAGLSFRDVVSLFESLGGRISEKKGGSSHVTMTYYLPGGEVLKHELWRPHGGTDNFGYKTVEGLHRYFEKCGLTMSIAEPL